MDGFTKGVTLAVIFIIYFSASTQAKLKLLNVVFRHGDRAPDDNGLEMYPNDPYILNEFDPMGLGGLTNSGKMREYRLGQHLRRHYTNFLNETYYPFEVKARSTDTDRTKMSLQLVLAALYRPKNKQKWNPNLDWQPIPAKYVPKLDDNLMVPEECPKYLYAREKVENSKEFMDKLKEFDNLMANLTIETGKKVNDSNDMYFLYHNFMAEQSMGLELPHWAKNIFPNGRLLDGINLEYEIFSYNNEMKRLNGGMLLRKFIDDMDAYKDGSLDNRRKLQLYSGHETNVAAVLQALGVYEPHAPAYSSAVFVELHEEGGEYFVKVKYYKGIKHENELISEYVDIPRCKKHCTLDNFRDALKDVIPSDEDIQCDKRSLRETLKNNRIAIPSGISKQILDELAAEDKIRNTLV